MDKVFGITDKKHEKEIEYQDIVDRQSNEQLSKLFKVFKNKTLSINSRNSAIKTNAKSKYIFDASILSNDSKQRLLEWLISESDEEFVIDQESYESDLESKSLAILKRKPELDKNLVTINSFGDIDANELELIANSENADIRKQIELQEERDKIQEEYNKFIKEITQGFNRECINRFKQINNKSIEIHKQTGGFVLYAGIKFISGQLQKSEVNAPLILFPLEIVKITRDIITIKHSNNRDSIINKPVLLLIESLTGIKTTKSIDNDNLTTIVSTDNHAILKELFNNSPLVATRNDNNIQNISTKNNGQMKLELYNAISIGIYNVSTSIYDDYSLLEEKKPNNIIKRLMNNDSRQQEIIQERNLFKNTNYKTSQLCLMSSLDSSQETAVYMSMKSNGLVIYGPPGTGKSQVITNIITNELSKKHRILLVSEKVTALQVVYNRLAKLNYHAIMINDSSDINSFREKFSATCENYLDYDDYKPLDEKRINESNLIDSDIDKLEQIHNALSSELGNSGKTLSFMFSHSKESTESSALALIINRLYPEIYEHSYDELITEIDSVNSKNMPFVIDLVSSMDIEKLSKYSELELMDIKDKVDERGVLQHEIKVYLDNNHYTSIDEIITGVNYCRDILKQIESTTDIFDDIEQTTKSVESVSDIDTEKYLVAVEKIRTLKEKNNQEYCIESLDELNENIELLASNKFNSIKENISRLEAMLSKIECNYVPSFSKNVKNINADYETIDQLIAICNNCKDNEKKILEKYNISFCESSKMTNYIINKTLSEAESMFNIISSVIYTYNGKKVPCIERVIGIEQIQEMVQQINTYIYKKNSIFKKFDNENINNLSMLESARKYLSGAYREEIINNTNIDVNSVLNSEKHMLNIAYNNGFIDKDTWVRGSTATENANALLYFISSWIKLKIADEQRKYKTCKDELYSDIKYYIDNKNHFSERINIIFDEIRGYLNCTIGNEVAYINKFIEVKTAELLNIENEYKLLKAKNDRIIEINTSIDEHIKYDDIIKYISNYDSIQIFLNSSKYIKSITRLLCKYTKEEIINAYSLYHISKYRDINAMQYLNEYKDIINNINRHESINNKTVIDELDQFLKQSTINKLAEQPNNVNFVLSSISKKRKTKSIRQVVSENKEMLFAMYHVWMMTPETVSDVLPLESNLFDTVIFDEASQMFLYNAMPSLYRAHKAIIAGDDKQLKPSNFFKTEVETEDMQEIIDDTVGKDASLLDQAKVNFSSVNLMFHYRAKYAELINFSNYAFYNNNLKLAPNVIRNSNDNRPIEYCITNGTYNNGVNTVEAVYVTKLVDRILEETKCNKSIGIITLNIKQKQEILDQLELYAETNQKFNIQYSKAKCMSNNGEDISIFVKAIEEVQGDERDIIIFSIGLGKDSDGKMHSNLGPIQVYGGENRLNVAISRAKEKEYIVASVYPESLSFENSKNNGPKLFKEFLSYANAISNGNTEAALAKVNNKTNQTQNKFDSPFEEQVFMELHKLGWDVETQVGVRGYRIDLAVYDSEIGRYIAGIECDGATYHSSQSARERDISRQRFLEGRGWNILRIWSTHWWKNSASEITKIDHTLRKLQDEMKKSTIQEIANEQLYENNETDNSGLIPEDNRNNEIIEEEPKLSSVEEKEICNTTDNYKICTDSIDMLSAEERRKAEKGSNNLQIKNLATITKNDTHKNHIKGIFVNGRYIEARNWWMVLSNVIEISFKIKDLNYMKVFLAKYKWVAETTDGMAKPQQISNYNWYIESKVDSYGLISRAQIIYKVIEDKYNITLLIDYSDK